MHGRRVLLRRVYITRLLYLFPSLGSCASSASHPNPREPRRAQELAPRGRGGQNPTQSPAQSLRLIPHFNTLITPRIPPITSILPPLPPYYFQYLPFTSPINLPIACHHHHPSHHMFCSAIPIPSCQLLQQRPLFLLPELSSSPSSPSSPSSFSSFTPQRSCFGSVFGFPLALSIAK
ncbi:hypothetical protein BDDG_06010 [Blastomyces dermatitidis ATCC 18188]|uniref:Uncharacterized protein n=1 Tax=Ajellomyces dermatitidis (strain ATCC 18188 / CBS 674.68) TaxID=653446 RepID=F2TIK3_AJEDA|nr:hypothetical protein BDDG_06010 [Blastomyces dermatitidis ATCC 18188]